MFQVFVNGALTVIINASVTTSVSDAMRCLTFTGTPVTVWHSDYKRWLNWDGLNLMGVSPLDVDIKCLQAVGLA